MSAAAAGTKLNAGRFHDTWAAKLTAQNLPRRRDADARHGITAKALFLGDCTAANDGAVCGNAGTL